MIPEEFDFQVTYHGTPEAIQKGDAFPQSFVGIADLINTGYNHLNDTKDKVFVGIHELPSKDPAERTFNVHASVYRAEGPRISLEEVIGLLGLAGKR